MPFYQEPVMMRKVSRQRTPSKIEPRPIGRNSTFDRDDRSVKSRKSTARHIMKQEEKERELMERAALKHTNSNFSFQIDKLSANIKKKQDAAAAAAATAAEQNIDAIMQKNWAEGRRMRKDGRQIHVLQAYFDENPVWSDEKKRAIAQEIGMTRHQVSKWNWDMRKKKGIPTPRLGKKKAGT